MPSLRVNTASSTTDTSSTSTTSGTNSGPSVSSSIDNPNSTLAAIIVVARRYNREREEAKLKEAQQQQQSGAEAGSIRSNRSLGSGGRRGSGSSGGAPAASDLLVVRTPGTPTRTSFSEEVNAISGGLPEMTSISAGRGLINTYEDPSARPVLVSDSKSRYPANKEQQVQRAEHGGSRGGSPASLSSMDERQVPALAPILSSTQQQQQHERAERQSLKKKESAASLSKISIPPPPSPLTVTGSPTTSFLVSSRTADSSRNNSLPRNNAASSTSPAHSQGAIAGTIMTSPDSVTSLPRESIGDDPFMDPASRPSQDSRRSPSGSFAIRSEDERSLRSRQSQFSHAQTPSPPPSITSTILHARNDPSLDLSFETRSSISAAMSDPAPVPYQIQLASGGGSGSASVITNPFLDRSNSVTSNASAGASSITDASMNSNDSLPIGQLHGGIYGRNWTGRPSLDSGPGITRTPSVSRGRSSLSVGTGTGPGVAGSASAGSASPMMNPFVHTPPTLSHRDALTIAAAFRKELHEPSSGDWQSVISSRTGSNNSVTVATGVVGTDGTGKFVKRSNSTGSPSILAAAVLQAQAQAQAKARQGSNSGTGSPASNRSNNSPLLTVEGGSGTRDWDMKRSSSASSSKSAAISLRGMGLGLPGETPSGGKSGNGDDGDNVETPTVYVMAKEELCDDDGGGSPFADSHKIVE
ncbi:hypothetical protein HDU76_008883 [Blyttiomyces sp. JEL0837]|nr:hypothetical protein HDU76_008883 [Blyttiomyces sp. JEL0837]